MNTALYEDEREEESHFNTIEVLARDFGCPVEEIEQLYETELKRLKRNARIKDFLAVLVTKRLKEIYSR